MRHIVAVIRGLLIAGAVVAAFPVPARAANCQFVLGFRTLHNLIPNVVGDCLTNEQHNPLNGDGLQKTTGPTGSGGLLVWRKTDNVTAFTDGYRTWLIGPLGLQVRRNTERFAWEPKMSRTPAPPGTGCRGGNPLANVHDPKRLTVVQRCLDATGVVTRVTTDEPDGDVFIDLRPIPRDQRLLNAQNLAQQNGNLVVEIVPADQPGCVIGQPPRPRFGTADFGICTGAKVSRPRVGESITVRGPYVLDTDHGWMEIHPVWAIFPASS